MMARAQRKAEILLEYQNYIETPPTSPPQLYAAACGSDGITIESWRSVWISNMQKNHAKFGGFKQHSVGKLFGLLKNKPAIIVGSGPSLKVNGDALKNRNGITAISCLHNYHFFEDRGIDIDYYVTLDAGPVVIEEVYEGGTKTQEEYWASTKNKKLIAFIGTDPRLFELWQGEVILYNAPIPDQACIDAYDKVEKFNCYISNGGNVLGACLYIAKSVMGANPIVYMGADFSFGYDKRFHAWNSKYDKNLGHVLKAIDVYGNAVKTWNSYANFKAWFECVAIKCPGIWINCTEGGTLGAYPEGNIMAIRQMPIQDLLDMYGMSEHLRGPFTDPENSEKKLLF
jgi:hypothetical protein